MNLDAWVAETYNPYDKNIFYICETEVEINELYEKDPVVKNFKKKQHVNKEEYLKKFNLKYISNDPVFKFAELYNSLSLDKIPIILITFDQLTNLENLPQEILDQMPNFQRAKQEMMYFNNHYTTGQPCSSARSEIYTGQISVKSTMSDNNESSWQPDLVTPDDGLDTIGSLLKKSDKYDYYNRYIGKWHLGAKELSPQEFTNSFPQAAQGNFLQKYGYDRFNDRGDYAYDKRGGIYTDSDTNELRLPVNYLDSDNMDTKNPTEGALPFLDKKIDSIESEGKCWSMTVNYTNPHDIAYLFSPNSDLNNAFQADNTPSGKTYPILGVDVNSDQYKQSKKLMNFDITSLDNFKVLQDQNKARKYPPNAENNNSIFSEENTSGYSYCDINSMYTQSTSLYGIDSRNNDVYLDFIEQYRNAYFNLIKQVDSEFGILWDKILEKNLHKRAVIMITSDHGDTIGDHGLIGKAMSFYKKSWNVPLFLSYPLMDENLKNKTFSNYSVHRQIMPTLLYFSNNQDLFKKYKNNPFDLELQPLAPPIFDKFLEPVNYNVVAVGASSLYTSFGPMASISTTQKLKINPILSNIYQISSVNKYNYNNRFDEYSFSVEFSLMSILKSSFKDAFTIKKEDLKDYTYWYSLLGHTFSIIVSKKPIDNSSKIIRIAPNIVDKILPKTNYVICNSDNINEYLLLEDKNKLLSLINDTLGDKTRLLNNKININTNQLNDITNFLNSIYKRKYFGIQTTQKILNTPQKSPKIIGDFYNPIIDFNSFDELFNTTNFTFKLFNNTTDPDQNFNLLDPKRGSKYFDIASIVFSQLKDNMKEQKLEHIYFTGPFYSILLLLYQTNSSGTNDAKENILGNFNLLNSKIRTNFNFNPVGGTENEKFILSNNYKSIFSNLRNQQTISFKD